MPPYLLPALILTLALTGLLAWKWRLGVLRVACAVLVIFAVWSPLIATVNHNMKIAPVLGIVGTTSVVVASAGMVLLYCFYRDPARITPPGDGMIVSPADGEVVYVHRVRGGELPVVSKHGTRYPLQELMGTSFSEGEAYVVGIAMNFLDVHVNRSPITGTIAMTKHFPGSFGSLRKPEMVFKNERATTIIDGGDLRIAVVQIASRLVRRIVSFVSSGDDVERGQRIGAIRFGSQVDLVLPASSDLRIEVRSGDHVTAGTTVVAMSSGSDDVDGRVGTRAEETP